MCLHKYRVLNVLTIQGGVIVNILLIVCVLFLVTKTKKYDEWLNPKSTDHYDNWAVKWAVKGWDRTLASLRVDTVDAVFLGNSITYGGNFENAFPDKKVVVLAFPGDHLKGIALRASMMKHFKTRKVFLMGGINGLKTIPLDSTKVLFDETLDSISKYALGAEIYVQSILPLNNIKKSDGREVNPMIVSVNRFIKEMAEHRRYKYVDLYNLYVKDGQMPANLTKDCIHHFPSAYERWYREIYKYMYE